MEDTRTSSRVGDYNEVYRPCSYIREAVSSILKCLGFDHESKPYVNDDINDSSCSKEQDNNSKEQSCYGKDDKSSYTAPPDRQLSSSDPPSTTMDPPDDPPMEDLARRGRPPPRPGISTGRDPQTNSTSS